MAHRSADWQSFPIEFRTDFPSLEETAASAHNNRRRSHRNRIPNAVLNLRPLPQQPIDNVNFWNNRSPRPSVPEWPEDDVNVANNAQAVSFATPTAVIQPVQELKTVDLVFTDRVIAASRLKMDGYATLGHDMMAGLAKRRADPLAQYRSISITIEEYQDRRDTWLCNAPTPSVTPKWLNVLPDNTLNEEYKLIAFLRPLDVPLSPRALKEIERRCPYLSVDNRTMPIYHTDITATPVQQRAIRSQPEVSQTDSIVPWNGPSNDVRMSGSSASSSQHDVSSQYGRQSKQNEPYTEFWNGRYSKRTHNRGYRDEREQPRSREYEYASSHADQEWDDDYEYAASQSSRCDGERGYGRKNENYRSESRGGGYGYREDSGYQEEYHEVFEREPIVSSPLQPPFYPVRTTLSSKTPVWRNDDEVEESSGEKRDLRLWRGRRTDARPKFLKKRNEMRDGDRDARQHSSVPDIPSVVRRAFRCLEGISASSSTSFTDDMHRVELMTWSGETDTEEVKMRIREKYGIDEMDREISERRVKLALPRTTITLSVGAGGETEILFDDELTDVLVMEKTFDDIKDFISETIVKTRDFISYNPAGFGGPSISNNTIITFGSIEESREMRKRLSDNGLQVKKIPRDLIIGNWDGSYAKRECLLELEWERNGTHGFSVRINKLHEQNNLVDRVMREKSEYFMTSHISMEELYNKMYVAVPSSPFSVEDDLNFLKKLLDANGIDVAGIQTLTARDAQTIDTKQKQTNCKFAINRRMLKVAIEEGVWGGFHPTTVQEWQMMLDGDRFSWDVRIHPETEMARNRINSATVLFDSFEQGERIAAQAQRMTPTPIGDDRFILNKEDRKGVFARAKLRVHYNVPLLVHSLTLHRLKALDDKWRGQSYFNHADFQTEREPFISWTCLITAGKENTPPGYMRLIVEGFPKSAVEDSCAQLLNVLRGDVIKCEEDESWLLTGIGRTMANVVAKEALENKSVLVDFNVMGKEIRLIGEIYNTMDVEARLRSIAKKRENHVMKTVVTIGQPVYMNRTSKAIECCGGLKMIEKVVGECKITICPEDPDKRSLVFEGTVRAYDRFRDFLGDLDDTLRHSAMKDYEKQRKTNTTLEDPSLSPLTSALVCPICSCRPSVDFYRLEACGHVYCTPCIYHQLHSELSTRTLPLSCRRSGCNRKLAISDILRLLLGRDPEEKLQTASVEHLDEVKLRPLVTAIVTNALQTQRDRLIACRTADCAGIFPRHSDPNALVRCKTCERATCGACGYEPHRGYTCEEYESLRDNVDASIASYMKNKKVRKCPNGSCSAVIEKTVGCNHMECVICRTHFCWLCGHASRTQGEIYAHMQNDHGGNGLHMDDGEMFMLQFD